MFFLLRTLLCVLLAFMVSFGSKPRPKKKTVRFKKEVRFNSSFPLKISKNGRYLTDRHNHPFLLQGDAAWTLLHKLKLEEAKIYLDDRKNKFFNTIFLQLLPPEPGQKNAYGQAPFLKSEDFSTPNEAYFSYVETIVYEAAKRNMQVALVPAWLGCCGGNWFDIQHRNGVEKCNTYGKYVATRLRSHPNILWIMGGDRDPLREAAVQEAMAAGIKSVNVATLMTFHAASSHSSTDVFPKAKWLDFSMVYSYFRNKKGVWTNQMPQVYEVALNEYQKHPHKAFILGESQYEDENVGTPQMVRRQAYWTMLSGGSGHCYGSSLWAFPAGWQRVLPLPGAFDMAHFFRIFTEMPWELLQPDVENKLVLEGRGVYGADDYAAVATLPNRRMAVVYLPTGRKVKMNVELLKGSTLRATWISPRSGKRWLDSSFKGIGVRTFTPPTTDDDWILIVGNVGQK
jgi:Protein of unknown function (DUF4038)/Putative collagen-binding domain of a collagenase